jgi:hypothetical protein
MAGVSTSQTNNNVVKFRDKVLFDYLRKNRFSPYMGNSMNSIIYRLFDLRDRGNEVNIPLALTLSAGRDRDWET